MQDADICSHPAISVQSKIKIREFDGKQISQGDENMTVGGITGQNFLNKLHSQKKKDNQNETQAGTTFSNNLKENDILSKGAKDDKTKTGNLSKRDDITSVNSSVYSNNPLHRALTR